MDIDLDSISNGGNSYQKFLESIRDATTKRKYKSYLHNFLIEIPDNVYMTVSETIEESDESKANLFAFIAKNNQNIAHGIIAEYIKLHKKRVEKQELNPNTLPNLIKPIHALLDSNGVAIHWKSLYKMYPRPKKTEDRTYTRTEIQKIMELSHDLTDKVILTVFSSAGFRVEA